MTRLLKEIGYAFIFAAMLSLVIIFGATGPNFMYAMF